MATQQDFKYVIQTELQLTPSAINNLLQEVSNLDNKLKDRLKPINVGVKANLIGNSVQEIQRKLDRLTFTAKVKLKVDTTSLAREVQSQIDRLDATRPTVANATPAQTARVGRRVSEGGSASRQTSGPRISADAHPDVVAARVRHHNAMTERHNIIAQIAQEKHEAWKRDREAKALKDAQPRVLPIGQARNLYQGHPARVLTVANQQAEIEAARAEKRNLGQLIKERYKEHSDYLKDQAKMAREKAAQDKRMLTYTVNERFKEHAKAQKEIEQREKNERTAQINAVKRGFNAEARELGQARRARAKAPNEEKQWLGLPESNSADHELRVLETNIRMAKSIQSRIAQFKQHIDAATGKISIDKLVPHLNLTEAKKGLEQAEKDLADFGHELEALERRRAAVIANSQLSNSGYNSWLFNNRTNGTTGARNVVADMINNQSMAEYAKAQEDAAKAQAAKMNKTHGEALVENRARNRVGQRTQAQVEAEAKDIQKRLLNPDNGLDINQRSKLIEQLEQRYKELAVATGQNLTKSIRFAHTGLDGITDVVSTTTKEFTKYGDVIDRGDKSMGKLFKTMGSNIVLYSAVSMGFYQIVQAIGAGVKAMAEFETQFIGVQRLLDSRDKQISSGELVGENISSGQSKRDIFKLSNKNNLDVNNELSPVYQEVLRRGDLFKSRDDVNRFTQTLVNIGYNATNGDLNSASMMGTTKDSISVYQNLFSLWTGQGKNAMDEMDRYGDFLSLLHERGADLGVTLDAMSSLSVKKYTGSSGANVNTISALAGAYSLADTDATGANISTSLKMFFENLQSRNSTDSERARQTLGIDLIDPITQQQKTLEQLLQELSKNISDGKYSDATLASAASGLAGSGGRLAPQMSIILSQLPTATKLASQQGYGGLADESAQKYIHSLAREFAGLGNSLKELAINLGDAGLLNGLKLAVGAFKGLVDAINFLLVNFNAFTTHLSNMDNLFGGLSATLIKFGIGLTGVLGAMKIGKAVFNKFGGEQIKGIVGGGIAGIGREAIEAETKKGMRGQAIGSVAGDLIGNIIGSVLFGGSKKLGGNVEAKAATSTRFANAAGNMLGKFGDAISKAVPHMKTFGLLLGRLSLYGGIAIAAWETYSYLNKRANGITAERATNLSTRFKENPEGLMGDLNRYLGYRETLRNNPDKPGFTALSKKEADDFTGLIHSLKDDSIQIKKKGFFAQKPTIGYNYRDNDGNMQQGWIDDSSIEKRTQGLQLMYDRLEAGNKQVQQMKEAQEAITQSSYDYVSAMESIAKISKEIAQIQTTSQLNSLGNNFNFLGATNTPAYLKSEIQNQKSAYEKESALTAQSIAKLKDIQTNKLNADSTVSKARDIVLQHTGGQASVDAVDTQLQSALRAGNNPDSILESFAGGGKELDNVTAMYAQALVNQKNLEQGLEDTRSETDKSTQSMAQLAITVKELQTAYLVASAGVAYFDGMLRATQSSVAVAQSVMALASNDTDKIGAQKNVIDAMTQQYEVQAMKVAGIQGMMEKIKKSNPTMDTSYGALYNPQSELTEAQSAYKTLLEAQQDGTTEANATLASIREQNDQMADLVLNSQKYASTWASVQDRISTASDVAKEMKQLSYSNVLTNKSASMRSLVMGAGFDNTDYRKQQAASTRDQYLSLYDRIQGTLATYGDDTKKLKEALSEIGATTKSKIDEALIQPMKDLIDNGFSTAVTNFGDTVLDLKNFIGSQIGTTTDDTDTTTITTTQSVSKAANMNIDNLSGHDSLTVLKKAGNINNVLGGKLAGYGSSFVKYGNQYGIDPALMAAISMHETGNGTNRGIMKLNNVGGLMRTDGKGQISFGSVDESIEFLAKTLGRYKASGKDTIAKIQKTYAPVGAGNDPTNLNSNWIGGVTKFLSLITGAKYGTDTVTSDVKVKIPNATIDSTNSGKVGNGFTHPADADQGTPNGSLLKVGSPKGSINVGNKASGAAEDNKQAQAELLAQLTDIFKQGIKAQADYLTKTNIGQSVQKQINDSAFEALLSGNKVDAITGKYDAIQGGRRTVRQSLRDDTETMNVWNQAILDKGKEAQAAKKAGDMATYNARKAEIAVLRENVQALKAHAKSLKDLDKKYSDQLKNDPRINAKEAEKLSKEQLGNLVAMQANGKMGTPEYYQAVEAYNSMRGSFASRDKNIASQQEMFDNTGFGYSNLAKDKIAAFNEGLTLLAKQTANIGTVLANTAKQFGVGSNEWHVVLEDAVAAQEKIDELENKKLATTKRYFELTAQGIGAYIKDRAYVQNRDIRRSRADFDQASAKYHSTYQNNPNASYTEGMVSLQIASDAYTAIQRQVQDYRDAVVESFRAGVIGIGEYIKKLNELRNVQEESRNQAIELKDSLESTFHESLANALKSGFEGSMSAPQDFMNSIKSGIASAISNQMSTVMLTQSGLMDTINNMIAQLMAGMTTGDPNDAVNLFNNMDIGALLNDTMAPFLPLIQQIMDSTNGIFGIMKDEVYNAPTGFKIDSALYEIQKAKTYDDVMGGTEPARDVNEAGAPSANPSTGSGGNIVLPPTSTPIGSGYNQLQNEVILPTDSISPVDGIGAIISGIINMKEIYGTSGGDIGDDKANQQADKLRELLGQLAPDVSKAIGDGKTGKSLEQMKDYLNSAQFIQDAMNKGIDISNDKLQGIINATMDVATAIANQRASSGSGGGVTNPSQIPSGASDTGTANPNNNPKSGSGSGGGVIDTGTANGGSTSGGSHGYIIISPWNGAQIKVSKDSPLLGAPYYAQIVGTYHTGGIAGVMNFANGNKLAPNEIQAVLRKGEPVFSSGQLGSFLDFMGGGNKGSSQAININVNINGNASGIDDKLIADAIRDGVAQGMSQVQRNGRLQALQTRGVSY